MSVSILVVCTGNICRSPLAEGFLRQLLESRFAGDGPVVSSAGTAGWDGSPAHPETVQAARQRDIDLSVHVARRLLRPQLEVADLVLGMAGEHRSASARLSPRTAGRTFTLKELVRLLEELPPLEAGTAFDPGAMRRRVAQAEELRRSGFVGNALDEDVSDPLGFGPETFRAVAWELHDWCSRLVDGLFGRVPARTSIWDPDE